MLYMSNFRAQKMPWKLSVVCVFLALNTANIRLFFIFQKF